MLCSLSLIARRRHRAPRGRRRLAANCWSCARTPGGAGLSDRVWATRSAKGVKRSIWSESAAGFWRSAKSRF